MHAHRQLVQADHDLDRRPGDGVVSLNGLNSMWPGSTGCWRGSSSDSRASRSSSPRAGAGWIPYILERADKAFFDHAHEPNLGVGQKFKGKVPPSQLFAEHMYVCLVDEHFALRALGDIPVDNLLWEGDYPHGDGLWPDNRRTMEKSLVDVPDDGRGEDHGDQLSPGLRL